MENVNWPALIFYVLLGVVLLLSLTFGKPKVKKVTVPAVSRVVPPLNQISLLMTHYGFDLEGAKVMWEWIRTGKADDESLVLDIFAQKIYREDYLSLRGYEAKEFFWNKPDAFKHETLRTDPRYNLEHSEIINFIETVRSI